MKRAVALLVFVVVGRAVAGAELTADQLLREATPGGVALVANDIDGAAVVSGWLSPTHLDRPVAALRGPCVPDRALLERWRAAHATHPGRPVWDAVLRDGTTTQIVFLRGSDTGLVPVCETEVLRGQGFSQSPDFAAWQRTLSEKMPIPAPPLPPAPSSAPAAPGPAPSAGGGCW